jgi:adenosyl cobinamide kinase/adenosyl cobinamide phosphate guanylyltransferase
MIYLITGGERSGEMDYVAKFGQRISSQRSIFATARKWDADFQN